MYPIYDFSELEVKNRQLQAEAARTFPVGAKRRKSGPVPSKVFAPPALKNSSPGLKKASHHG